MGIGSTVSVNPDFVQAFITKLCIVAHHCEAECRVKRLVCYLQVQVHSGACKSNMTVFAVLTADPFATKLSLMVLVYAKVSSEKIGCCVKVTAKFENADGCFNLMVDHNWGVFFVCSLRCKNNNKKQLIDW